MERIVVGSDALEILDCEECFRLLATATIGRIGITVGALPVVLPISFQLQGDQVVFVAAVGSTLDAATRDAVVAFEADDLDAGTCDGWSVTGTGTARDASETETIDFAAEGLRCWESWGDDRMVVVSTEMLSGRRIRRRSRSPEGGVTMIDRAHPFGTRHSSTVPDTFP